MSRRPSKCSSKPSYKVLKRGLTVPLFLLGTMGSLSLAPHVRAQSITAQATKSYDIPAGPLSQALTRFSREAGIYLVGNGQMVEGKTSAGLKGSFSVHAGLFELLANTGLVAVVQADGSYGLRSAQTVSQVNSEGAATLNTVTVKAPSQRPETTEMTGSYAVGGPSTTATRLPMTLRETPQTISVMTRQRMDDEGMDSIETVLDRTPGISVQNIGASRFSILSRGYDIDNYQFDGILTATDIVSQNVPQSQADLAIYDRVEVLRGAAGLLAGAGNPSGTINLVRKKPTRSFQGYASLTGGSWGRGRAEVDLSGSLNSSGSLRGRLVAAHEQGGTHIDWYKQKKSVLYGVMEADLTPQTLLTVGMDYQSNDPRGQSSTGLPLFYSNGEQTNFNPATNAAARWKKNEMDVYNTFMKLEHYFPNEWKLGLSANYMQGRRDFSGADASWGFPDKLTGEGVRLYGGLGSARQRQGGVDAQLQGPFELLGRQHEGVFGFNWSDFKNFHEPQRGAAIEGRYVNIYEWDNETAGPTITGQKLYDYDGWQKQGGAYGAVRFKPRDDLTFIAGARVSNYRYRLSLAYTAAASAANNRVTNMHETGVVTPYAGVVYNVNETHSVYASYTSIFKPQSSRDRNGDVLAPREGNNFEVGLKSDWLGGKLTSTVALYEIRQNNLAEVDSGQTVPGTSPAEAAYRAVQGARTRGIDVELNGELARGWQLSASYSYGTTEDANGQRIRTIFPRQMAKLWTSYRFPGTWSKLTLGGGVNWQSRIYYSATSSGLALYGQQKAYAVTGLMARYDFSPQLSLTLNVNNVFNQKYLQGLDTTFYTGIYGPTRNAQLTARYTF
ncbi:TonB-dependent siderophore receptor [Ottowia thiooxydans]|uniref:Outer membrane receptor for ferric coprogen and ferric-rhodotorulic acid n=1 Tax=Ottowia thiooxydans TaxID=219182 RepID=A0ABV2Q6B3_9BURK